MCFVSESYSEVKFLGSRGFGGGFYKRRRTVYLRSQKYNILLKIDLQFKEPSHPVQNSDLVFPQIVFHKIQQSEMFLL